MKRLIPPVIEPNDLDVLLNEQSGVRLLDVRTPGEFESVHIRGSYNVPLDTLGEHARDIQAHVDEPVVLICQSGSRARRAEEALKSAGMPNLHVLDGGINGWLAAEKVAVRGIARVSLERQVRMVAGAITGVGGLLAAAANPLFGIIPAMVGAGLLVAGATDSCAMGMLLARLPYNRPAACDVDAMVRALKTGTTPTKVGRVGTKVPVSAGSCAA